VTSAVTVSLLVLVSLLALSSLLDHDQPNSKPSARYAFYSGWRPSRSSVFASRSRLSRFSGARGPARLPKFCVAFAPPPPAVPLPQPHNGSDVFRTCVL